MHPKIDKAAASTHSENAEAAHAPARAPKSAEVPHDSFVTKKTEAAAQHARPPSLLGRVWGAVSSVASAAYSMVRRSDAAASKGAKEREVKNKEAAAHKGDVLVDTPDDVLKLMLDYGDPDTRTKAAVYRAQHGKEVLSIDAALDVLGSTKEKDAARKMHADVENDRQAMLLHRKRLENPSTRVEAFAQFADVAQSLFFPNYGGSFSNVFDEMGFIKNAANHPEHLRELLRLTGPEGERYATTELTRKAHKTLQALVENLRKTTLSDQGLLSVARISPSLIKALVDARILGGYMLMRYNSGEIVYNLALFHAGVEVPADRRNDVLQSACHEGDIDAVRSLVKQGADLGTISRIHGNAISIVEYMMSRGIPIPTKIFTQLSTYAMRLNPSRIPEIMQLIWNQGERQQSILEHVLFSCATAKPDGMYPDAKVSAIEALIAEAMKHPIDRSHLFQGISRALLVLRQESQDRILSFMRKNGFDFNALDLSSIFTFHNALDPSSIYNLYIGGAPALFITLVRLGADPNMRDQEGRTAIERIRSEWDDKKGMAALEKALDEYYAGVIDKENKAKAAATPAPEIPFAAGHPLTHPSLMDLPESAAARGQRLREANGNLLIAVQSRLLRVGDATLHNFVEQTGANVDHRNANGDTLAHIAVLNRDPDTLRVLLELGANRTLQNRRGNLTPLELAQQIVEKDEGMKGFPSLEMAAIIRMLQQKAPVASFAHKAMDTNEELLSAREHAKGIAHDIQLLEDASLLGPEQAAKYAAQLKGLQQEKKEADDAVRKIEASVARKINR